MQGKGLASEEFEQFDILTKYLFKGTTKTHASLQDIRKDLAPFGLPSIVIGQVIHLSRTLEEKTQAPESSRKELEFLHGKNSSQARQLKEFISVNLGVVIESFENALQQVEHFHHPLTISREQNRLDQVI